MRRLCAILCVLLCCSPTAWGEDDDLLMPLLSDPNVYDEEADLPEEHDDGRATPEPEITPEPVVLAHTASPSQSYEKSFTITVGGDTTLGSIQEHEALEDSFYAVVDAMGYGYPFSGILEYLEHDDMTLVNLEGPLTYSEDIQEKKYRFRGPPHYATILTAGSVEAVNLANNHSMDYGEEGLSDTVAALEEIGISYCGSKQTGIYEKDGIRVGLIGNTYPYGEKGRDITADVQALREEGCHIVIASFHWGSEYRYDFTREQRQIGRAAIDAGADVVVGHHPHVIQGIEKYKDRYILYSLGNLVFGGNMEPKDRDAYIAQLEFDISGDEIPPPRLRIIPVLLTQQTKGTDFRPVIPDDQGTERILKNLSKRSYEMEDEL